MFSIFKTEKNKLIFFLGVKAFLLLLYPLALAPDEAQYWCWSKALDWGYYSKPPGIAWQIALTTSLFGDNHFGVRFGAAVIGFLLPLVVYSISKKYLSERASFWTAVTLALSPLSFYLSFAATTDGGSILFLTLAFLALIKRENSSLSGFYILCGALYKWTAFLFWPIVFFVPEFRKKNLLGGIAISLLALLPTLYWNLSHDFATFKHVVGHMAGETKGNFAEYLIAQVGLFSPSAFILLVYAIWYICKERRKEFWPFLSFAALALCYCFAAFFKKMQPNWALYLYPPLFVLIGWVAFTKMKKGEKFLRLGSYFSVFCLACTLAIPYIEVPYKFNPFRQNMGGERLTEICEKVGFNPATDFLFADKYQNASLLSFYAGTRAYFFNLGHSRRNQFSYWPQMEEKELGKRGLFFVIENRKVSKLDWYKAHYVAGLTPYFQSVKFIDSFPLFETQGQGVKYALVFSAENYKGASPSHHLTSY